MELAFRHPYQLHSILAIAALETFHDKTGRSEYHRHAVAHHEAALNHARSLSTQVSMLNGHARSIFSGHSYMFAMAESPLPRYSPGLSQTFNPIHELVAAFKVGRGVYVIMESDRDNPDATPVPEPSRLKWLHDRDDAPRDFPPLQRLKSMVKDYCNAAEQKSYVICLDDLFTTILLLQRKTSSHSSTHLVGLWPLHIDACVLSSLEAESRVALVILAQYAIMLHLRRDIWFFEHWLDVLIADIDTKIEWGLADIAFMAKADYLRQPNECRVERLPLIDQRAMTSCKIRCNTSI